MAKEEPYDVAVLPGVSVMVDDSLQPVDNWMAASWMTDMLTGHILTWPAVHGLAAPDS